MSETNENEQFDADILKCKDDIIRANEAVRPIDTGETIEPEEPEKVIPKFELHKQILGQERKISAAVRKPPGQKQQQAESKARSGLIPDADSRQNSNKNENNTEHIISEIVARDIERLCRGEF